MLDIKNKIKFENVCYVGEVDASLFNSSEEARIKAVTDLASITTGKLGFKYSTEREDEFDDHDTLKNKSWEKRVKLYERLLVESAGKPSTPFEFVPAVFKADSLDSMSANFHRYGEFNYDRIYTNYRNILNHNYLQTIGNKKAEGFKIIVGQVPWKVISHLRTHRAFSWLVESSRNKRYLKDVEFWYPSWWKNKTKGLLKFNDNAQVYYYKNLTEGNGKQLKPEEATMELSDRRLVKFAMCAWKQDKNAWQNLFETRGSKTGTMSITGITVDNIKKLIL